MMVVDRVNGQVQANMDDMELIVTAANITGYFENAGMIVVGDDMELTQFCLTLYGRIQMMKAIPMNLSLRNIKVKIKRINLLFGGEYM